MERYAVFGRTARGTLTDSYPAITTVLAQKPSTGDFHNDFHSKWKTFPGLKVLL